MQRGFFSLNLTLRPWPKPEARRAVLGLFPAAAPDQIQGGSSLQAVLGIHSRAQDHSPPWNSVFGDVGLTFQHTPEPCAGAQLWRYSKADLKQFIFKVFIES